jgi:hypothetical protein
MSKFVFVDVIAANVKALSKKWKILDLTIYILNKIEMSVC